MLPTSLRPLIRLTPTLAPVSRRAVLSVSGSEAAKFLNGVVASTVPIPAKGPYFTCFLNAQGRVIADAIVYTKKNAKGQDGYLIEYDAGLTEPALLPFLKRYVLRAKVKIEDVSHQYQVWAAWGSEEQRKWEGDRSWNFASSGVIEPVWEPSDPWPWGHEECMIQDRRAVGMGMRMLLPAGERPTQAKTHDIADSDAYKLHRIMHGVPEGIDDIPPSQAFPMESNLDVMGGLDFRKGCYVGQELTVRTYHTGLLRKRILPVEVDAPARSGWREPTESKNPPPPANSHIGAVRNPGSEGDGVMIRGKGKLLSTTQGVGLALLRLEHVEGVEKGTMTLKIESDEPKEGEKESQSWIVKPWWPIWWPKP